MFYLRLFDMKRILVVLMLGIMMVSCGSAKEDTSTTVKFEDVLRVNVMRPSVPKQSQQLSYSGLCEPSVTIPLSFMIPGRVESINVEVGSAVTKGAVLARLEETTSRSGYNAASAMQLQAQDAYERLKKVYNNGSLPEIKWEEIKSKLEQANSSLIIARENLSNCQITAPTSGVIGSRSIEVGENAIPGVSVFSIVSVANIDVKISVPEDEINRITIGQNATVTFSALDSRTLNGVVEQVAIVANSLSKTFDVKIRIRNLDMKIRPGMVCNVSLQTALSDSALLVPLKSVMKDEFNLNYLFVVDRGSHIAKRRTVQVKGIVENSLRITSGLNKGEWIVIDGQQKLTDNCKVIY